MEKELYKTKNTDKNKDLVNVIKNGLADLEKRIEEMSKMKLKMNGYMIEWILQIFFMLMIGTKKKKGLKIITLNQMLSRLPITLAQLKEGYNSEKLKNVIKQILYSLYHSK